MCDGNRECRWKSCRKYSKSIMPCKLQYTGSWNNCCTKWKNKENMYCCQVGSGRNGNNKYDKFWSYKNPLAVYEVPSRGCKVGVWCVVNALKVMEPVLFRRNKLWPVTLVVTQLFRILLRKQFCKNFKQFWKRSRY